jgi:beta-1,4-mannosyl-glycoprotein beta-1,4-N-acetylglucosaminyltransferase
VKRKIFCAFPFFNEISLLRLKLEELYDTVDYFVISEANITHSGNPKPFYLKENEELLEKYSDKIIYIYEDMSNISNEFLESDDNDDVTNFLIKRVNASTWFPLATRSYFLDTWQKESVIRGLFPIAQDEDLIILGDLDEIPKASVVREIAEDFDDDEIYHLEHRFCWYFTNIQKTDEIWYGNILTSFKRFKDVGFCDMRVNKKGNFINDAGWHFSYQGGASAIKTKIESFGEQSLNLPQVKDGIEDNIKNCLINGHDLFFRPAKFEVIPINYETMPKYLVDHQEEFGHMIWRQNET